MKFHGAKKQGTRITASFGCNNVVEEKDFEFKPSFDEYLKAMKSIKKSGKEKQGPKYLRRKSEEDNKLMDFEGKISRGVLIIEEKCDDFSKIIEVNEVGIDEKKTGAKKVRKLRKKSIDSEENGSEVLDIERAAFKPLEEFVDVYDKPRVTRVDMEERIHKL